MNIPEAYPFFANNINQLVLTSTYVTTDAKTPYVVSQLSRLKDLISIISATPYIDTEIQQLRTSWLYQTTLDSISINSQQKTEVEKVLETLRIKLLLLKDIAENNNVANREVVVYVKLPDIDTFEELSKVSNELKKGIELPITEIPINGTVKILSADKGSIIFYVSLGTLLAVKIIGAICWAAAVIRKKNAEAKIFEAHARTLGLKNEALENIIEQQKLQYKNIMDAEAESIASKNYSNSDPETIERLKMSISAVQELIDKGAQISPLGNHEDVKQLFPDYSKLDLIESTIKLLKDSTQT